MLQTDLTPEALAAIAGVVLSFGFSYIPGLNVWYAALDGVHKRLIMAILIIVVGLAAFGLTCAGILNAGIPCAQEGVVKLIWLIIVALMANQSAFMITPQKAK